MIQNSERGSLTGHYAVLEVRRGSAVKPSRGLAHRERGSFFGGAKACVSGRVRELARFTATSFIARQCFG